MMTSPAPSATSRALRTANDWWCIRGFILGTYPITPVEFIWENRGWGGAGGSIRSDRSLFDVCVKSSGSGKPMVESSVRRTRRATATSGGKTW